MSSLQVQNTLMRMKRAEPKPRRFDEGGAVGEDEPKEYGREHREELGADERTRKYDKEFRHYYGDGERGFAKGGRAPDFPPGSGDVARVDGSGKVDGVHSSPAECSHLAGGGVCRHQPPGRKPKGDDHSDGANHVRNFAEGGKAMSFGKYLSKRRDARRHLKGA